MLAQLKDRFDKFNNPFVRNVGWMGASGVIIRVFRLITTVGLARFLSPYDFGLAAIVLTTNEFIQVFSRNGIGAKLIQAEEKDLEKLAQSAYWLGWLVFVGLFILQCLSAFPIAWFYHDNQIILPICLMATSFLLIPLAEVQSALIQRENRIKVIALSNTLQITVDNLLSLALAFAGLGMWAIVLPKVLVVPIWVYVISKNHSWRPKGKFITEHWGELLNFSRNVLGIELLKTLRNNMDYLIIGRFLGLQELGIYYFAFNAGLGISLGVINSINVALLPHLCAVRSDLSQLWERYRTSLKTIAFAIIPLVFVQSSLAPFYVPIIFGQKWVSAIPVLVLICLSAIPRPFADATSQLLLSVDKAQMDLRYNLLFTGVFTLSLLIGVQWQSLGVAIAVLATHAVLLPLFVLWGIRYVFNRLQLQQA
jgi:PST family polysaccharide transporter